MLFLEEKFLYKKITKKDVYMNYGATADIPEDAVKQYRYLTALKLVKNIIIIIIIIIIRM